MEFVPLLALALLLKKIMDWVREVMPDRFEAKTLIPISMILGTALSLLFSASEALGNAITIFTGVDGTVYTLGSADVYLVVVYGLFVGAVGGAAHDFLKPTTPPHDS